MTKILKTRRTAREWEVIETIEKINAEPLMTQEEYRNQKLLKEIEAREKYLESKVRDFLSYYDLC